jgi:uncharacterized protein (DUF1015 family)
MRVHPFTALLPAPDLAARVAAPPYDVVSRREAAQLAKDNPLSFIHVVRSEIDLPEDVDPYDARVYAKARETLDRLTATRVLLREQRPSCYLYQQVMEGRSRLGVVGCVHVDDYARGVIKRHETTRPDKEDDRTRHILALEAHAEPVLLAYRRHPEIDRLTARETRMPSLYDFTTSDGVSHAVWRVMEPAPYADVFGQVSCAYIADGHHRSASAWRAARERRVAHPGDGGGAEHDWFPTVLVPADELRILAYNRVITDLGGQSPTQLLSALSAVGRLSVTHEPAPPHPRSFCLYLEGRWYLLELNDASIDGKDPVRSLDVALLQERVLGPLLGIEDQRTDKRIAFVGGIRGARELEARVDSGEAALAVSMFPTSMAELMAVSDAGQMMPPKSTWFEPKLLSGLFIHPWN